jgi:uncharacterized cupin superfamily protein
MAQPERPSFIAHWTEIERPDDNRYDEDDELMSIGAPFGRAFGLTKLGIHHERLPPGRRTSFPHAESADEEFVYVIEGKPDVWIDGHLHRLKPGDAVGFLPGTGIAHSFLNNTDAEVRLLVVGERTKPENRLFYPRHPDRSRCTQTGGTVIRSAPWVLTTECRISCAPRRPGEKPASSAARQKSGWTDGSPRSIELRPSNATAYPRSYAGVSKERP